MKIGTNKQNNIVVKAGSLMQYNRVNYKHNNAANLYIILEDPNFQELITIYNIIDNVYFEYRSHYFLEQSNTYGWEMICD